MSMDDITILQGADFVSLTEAIGHAERTGLPIRMTQDEGAIKIKVGQYTWSPPLGQRDPQCMTAAPARRYPAAY